MTASRPSSNSRFSAAIPGFSANRSSSRWSRSPSPIDGRALRYTSSPMGIIVLSPSLPPVSWTMTSTLSSLTRDPIRRVPLPGSANFETTAGTDPLRLTAPSPPSPTRSMSRRETCFIISILVTRDHPRALRRAMSIDGFSTPPEDEPHMPPTPTQQYDADHVLETFQAATEENQLDPL